MCLRQMIFLNNRSINFIFKMIETHQVAQYVGLMDQSNIIIAVMDGDCALCSRGAQVIARADKSGRVRIATAQSGTGAELLRQNGMDPADPDSWLVKNGDTVHAHLDAILVLAASFGGLWRLTGVFWVLPKPLRDWIYRRIARNRYAMFGKGDMCALPDEKLRARLISD